MSCRTTPTARTSCRPRRPPAERGARAGCRAVGRDPCSGAPREGEHHSPEGATAGPRTQALPVSVFRLRRNGLLTVGVFLNVKTLILRSLAAVLAGGAVVAVMPPRLFLTNDR